MCSKCSKAKLNRELNREINDAIKYPGTMEINFKHRGRRTIIAKDPIVGEDTTT